MSCFDDEEFKEFVKKNSDLIRKMMDIQKGAAVDTLSIGKNIIQNSIDIAESSKDMAKKKTEDFVHTTYNMFTNPDIQKHFMAMGMEFAMGMSAIIQNAYIPNFIKNAASSVEHNWKKNTCKVNDECLNKKVYAKKIDINSSSANQSNNSEFKDP